MPERGTFRRARADRPLVIGHRGVRGPAPENTMAAFAMAADAGADGVELDVRLCGSGEVVVAHDPTLSRPTAGRDDRGVASLSWSEPSRGDLGGGERVPLLAEVIAFCEARGLALNVELKRDVPNRLAAVRATVRVLGAARDPEDRVVVSSFDPWMLGAFSMSMPRVDTGLLFGEEQHWLTSGWLSVPLRAVAVHPEHTLVSAERVRLWRSLGVRINTWTVNDPTEARAFAALGIDAVITDAPGAMLTALSASAASA